MSLQFSGFSHQVISLHRDSHMSSSRDRSRIFFTEQFCMYYEYWTVAFSLLAYSASYEGYWFDLSLPYQ